jgi:hypothetical protein
LSANLHIYITVLKISSSSERDVLNIYKYDIYIFNSEIEI